MTRIADQIPQDRPATGGGLRLALLAVMGLELWWLASGWRVVGHGADLAVLAAVALAVPRYGLREYYLVTFCGVLAAALALTHADPWTAIVSALDQAGFLMAFLLLVGLIQQAALTSSDVQALGRFLTGQRAGRRYLAIFLGTHWMAQLFNLGVLNLIGPLIVRGTADRSDPLNKIRARRQISAMLQGFGWGVIWSPTAIAPLTLVQLLPEADRAAWIMAGLVIALAVMAMGWLDDRLRYPPRPGQSALAGPVFPAHAFAGFAGLCFALLALTVAAMWLFDQSVVFGLMAASPMILVGWLLSQRCGDRAWVATRIGEITRTFLPKAAPIAVTLACSGFIGRAAAQLTPVDAIAARLDLMAIPGWQFLLGLTLGVTLLSLLALSPIMLAVFFGSIIADLPAIPVDVTWAALAISCGWALTMTISPFATTVLVTSQVTGRPGRVLTWHWNWRFSLGALAILIVAYRVLAGS